MFTLFRRPKKQSRVVRPRNRLPAALEQMEPRWCPTAPTVTLEVATGSERWVYLSGWVTDEDPASVVLTFAGVVTGATTPDTAGFYGYTAEASGLGTVSAVGVDNESLSSNTAQATVASAAPSVSFEISYGERRSVTLSGLVTDESAAGRTVQFTGVVAGSVVTAADGTFSYTADASGLGNIQATTTDPWGLLSNTAQAAVTSNAPVIMDLQVEADVGNMFTFSGRVVDECAAGLVVRFEGLIEAQTTVEQDGWFYLTIQIPYGSSGGVAAQTTDWWGLASNIAEVFVPPTP